MYDFIEKQLNIVIFGKKIHNIEINISKVGEKILFFYNIKDTNSIERYIDSLTYLFQKYGYKEMIQELINDEKTKNRFITNEEISLPEFLWDLYIIFINNKESIPIRIKNKLQRNDFFARKIIIEGKEKEEIIERLKEILFPENEINKLINDFGFTDKKIIKILFEDENGQTCEKETKEFFSYAERKGLEVYDLDSVKKYISYLNKEILRIKSDYMKLKGE